MARDAAYREAKKKIEKARLTESSKLDLSCRSGADDSEKLTELPESLGQLSQLRTINLDGNQLTTLPESLLRLWQLKELHLNGNQLTALPESLGQLSQLQTLYLIGNQLAELPESLRQLSQLKSLCLDWNRLTVLPDWLDRLSQLLFLHLDNNQLTVLPESLGGLSQLQILRLDGNQLMALPESLGRLSQLQMLHVDGNQLTTLPESLGWLSQLQVLHLVGNHLMALPESLGKLSQLQKLYLNWNQLTELPESLGRLSQLQELYLNENQLTTLPESLGQLANLTELLLGGNPLNPELAAANGQGVDIVLKYLRAESEGTIVLFEAKLILIGEGEVGKSCLLDALSDAPWQEYESTHGINIEPVHVTDLDSGTVITLNGWDFGGQRVYRPTHQLFFSAPAVYLVVWKPREGLQAGQVKEWIKLVKHREPGAKILVVSTHGGPRDRQPDIDQLDITSQFGSDIVVGFHHVDNKPDESGERQNISNLRDAISRVAIQLPEVGRKVPTKWQYVREQLVESEESWMTYDKFVSFCTERGIDEGQVDLFLKLSHTLGNLIHYDNDTTLRNIVILKPDWLATAISFVYDDAETRDNHGLVSFERLSKLWNNPDRKTKDRYPEEVHEAFVEMMERFDLSYEVQLPQADAPRTILISQLVPDSHPESLPEWDEQPAEFDIEQVQICRIVDDRGQSATAEGLFYQLIVRLHKYSLGLEDYHDSVHWQRGLMLDDDYNGRALVEHIGNDVKITVRAAFPERFLAMLTAEVKWLVENFWEGLRCEVTVPCAEPCDKQPGTALFEVQKLITFKKKGLDDFPCSVSGCDQLQNIVGLLQNATSTKTTVLSQSDRESILHNLSTVLRREFRKKDQKDLHRFRHLSTEMKKMMSQAEIQFDLLMQTLTDEAKEGPRLFSFEPVNRSRFNPKKFTSEKFRLTLWCENSRLPLPVLNGEGDTRGVYELELTKDWVKKAAPFLKGLTMALSLVLPITSSATKLMMNDDSYKEIANELDFGKNLAESLLKGIEKAGSWIGESDSVEWELEKSQRAKGGMLRELHGMLKEKDPASGFGGLVRVQNKRREFLWVHEQFVDEY